MSCEGVRLGGNIKITRIWVIFLSVFSVSFLIFPSFFISFIGDVSGKIVEGDEEYVLGAYTEYGNGRAFFYGDYYGWLERSAFGEFDGNIDVKDREMTRQFLLNTISWVGQDRKRLLIDLSHSQVGIYDRKPYIKFLIDAGYIIKYTERQSDEISFELLTQHDALLLMSVYKPYNIEDTYQFIEDKGFSDEEISNITNYVANGGGLFVVGNGDYRREKNAILSIGIIEELYNPILNEFGAAFKENMGNLQRSHYGNWNYNVVFEEHITTENISNLPLHGNLCSLLIENTVKPLIYLKKNNNFDQEPEEFKDSDQGTLLSCTKYGEGRVVFCGMNGLFFGEIFDEEHHRYDEKEAEKAQDLIMNIVNWLGRGGRKILIDQTHNQLDFYDERDGKSKLVTFLESSEFKVILNSENELETELSYDILSKFDMLFLIGFKRTFSYNGAVSLWNYSDSEIDNITRFVENGGGLLLVPNSQDKDLGVSIDIYNKLAERFGVKFNNDTIHVGGCGWSWDIKDHPLTIKINNLPVRTGCTIDESENAEELVYVKKTEEPSSWPCFLGALRWPFIIVLIIMIILISVIHVIANEIAKFKLLSYFSPLYSRLHKDKILDNKSRKKIRKHILANPGDHFNSIRRSLDLSQGALAYHLRTLEEQKFIKSVQSGMFRRFYPFDMKISENMLAMNKIAFNHNQEVIFKTIKNKPGLTQKEVSEKIDIGRSTVNHHINSMVELGVIRLEREGNKTKCYPVQKRHP